MSGVAQQFIKTGHMGPEDFDPNEGAWAEYLHDKAFTFDRVFKDGNQYINVKSALRAAADAELGLDEVRAKDEREFM